MHFLLCVDSAIGRIKKSSLSQQTLMEQLIDKMTNKERICRDAESPWDIKEWICTRTDDFHQVTNVTYGFRGLGGSIQLEWIPETVEVAFFNCNSFVGTVCLTSLPNGLKEFSVAENKLSGTIDVTKLPQSMETLCLDNNLFEGETDFSHLPDSLKIFYISRNTNLKGTIECTKGKKILAHHTQVDVNMEYFRVK